MLYLQRAIRGEPFRKRLSFPALYLLHRFYNVLVEMQRGPYSFPIKSERQTMFSPIKFGIGLPTVISEPPPTGFERKGNGTVAQKVPNNKGPKTVSHTYIATGSTDPTAQNLFGAKKGGKRSKTRRLSKKRRITRRLRKGSHQRGGGVFTDVNNWFDATTDENFNNFRDSQKLRSMMGNNIVFIRGKKFDTPYTKQDVKTQYSAYCRRQGFFTVNRVLMGKKYGVWDWCEPFENAVKRYGTNPEEFSEQVPPPSPEEQANAEALRAEKILEFKYRYQG